MEGESSEKREDPKPNHQAHSTFMPAFQNAQFPPYYPAYPGMSAFPLYSPHPQKPKRQLNKFTIFEKLQAIERVNFGETKAHVARSINVAESTLRGWFKNVDKLRILYETEEMPMQTTSSTSPSEYSVSSMFNIPSKIPRKEGATSFPESTHMLQAKTFNNYNYSWLEFFRNFENLPLQYFDTTLTNQIDEGPEFGRRFLRWMEDRMAKGDNKTFNIHRVHLETFKSLLNDIFRTQMSGAVHPQERKHIVGDEEDEARKSKPVVERKHIVGDDEEIEEEPKSMEVTDDDDNDLDGEGF